MGEGIQFFQLIIRVNSPMNFPNKAPKFKRRLDEVNKNKKEKAATGNFKRN